MMSSALLCGIVPESISDSNATPSNDSDVISVDESPSDATPSNGPSDDDGVNAFNMIQTPSSKKVRVATSGKKRKLGKAIKSVTVTVSGGDTEGGVRTFKLTPRYDAKLSKANRRDLIIDDTTSGSSQ